MKRKVTSKLLALTLLVTMATSMVGCSSGEADSSSASSSSSSSSTTSSTTETTTTTTTEEAVEEAVEEVLEPMDVTMAVRRTDANVAYDENPFMLELAEESGLNFSLIDWAAAQLTEKRNLAFASGVLPDAFYGGFILDSPDVANYGAQGYLLELTDYINADTMPNFTRLTEDRAEILPGISTPEGNIYALPNIEDVSYTATNDTLSINTQWLEAVGKEMPTTTDELFDVLMAFKEAGDLNGNGKSDEIPLTFQYNEGNSGLFGLIGFTGITYNNQHQRMARVDGEVVFVPSTDEFKEYLHFMHKLYSNGLMDIEAFTMDGAAYNAKTQNPEPMVGVISSWSLANINGAIEGNDPYADGVYQYVAPLTGPSGVDPVWAPRITPPNRKFSFAVNAETDQEIADRLINFADLHYDKYNSLRVEAGVEDLHFEMVGDMEYATLTKEDGSAYTAADRSVYVPSTDGIRGTLHEDGYYKNMNPVSAQGKEKAGEVYGDYLVKDEDYAKTAVMQTEEEIDRSTILMADMKDHVDMWVAKFITEGNIDENWDSYLSGLQAINIDEYVAIYQGIDDRARN